MPEQSKTMLPTRALDWRGPLLPALYDPQECSLFAAPANVSTATVSMPHDVFVIGEQERPSICGVFTLRGNVLEHTDNVMGVFCVASGSALKSSPGSISTWREREIRWLEGVNIEHSAYFTLGSCLMVDVAREREEKAVSFTGTTWGAIYTNLLVYGFSESQKSPFLTLDYRRKPTEQVDDLVEYVRSQLDAPYRNLLAARITALAEPEEGETEIDPLSLRNMINFLQVTPRLRQPTLSLSPDGNLTAIWRQSANKHFSAEFLPTGLVRFVVFRSNPRHSDRIDRFSGVTSGDTLMEVVAPHGVLTWAGDEGRSTPTG